MTFKAYVFGALASVLSLSAAVAADLPSVKAAPYIPPPPVFTWDGWHIGIIGGYGGGPVSSETIFYTPAVNGIVNYSVGTSGWLVGYEAGYNWQFSNNIVVGYESEFSYADVSSSNRFGAPQPQLQWFGAEKLRFGYAMGRFLPYITGGLAYGQTRVSGFETFAGAVFPVSGSTWQAGWTVGAGLEYAVWDNVSVKAEYLFTHLKGPRGAGASYTFGAAQTFQGRDFETHLARVGVNLRLDPMKVLSMVGLRF